MSDAVAEHKIDRTTWARGPWDQEPEDRIEWRGSGLPCLMLRNSNGAWCGYVGVPPGHPAYDKDYDDVEVEVHGGLTYGGRCAGHICHVPQPGETDAVFWFGFDCNHGGDAKPALDWQYRFSEHAVYRDAVYVRDEVNHLARQLAAMETPRP